MQPLPGIKDPLVTLSEYGLVLPSTGLTAFIFGIVFVSWLVYTLVVTYHWLRYSHASIITYPALFIHVVVSAACLSYAISGSTLPTL